MYRRILLITAPLYKEIETRETQREGGTQREGQRGRLSGREERGIEKERERGRGRGGGGARKRERERGSERERERVRDHHRNHRW
jgi:hypothetical protein